MPGSMNRNSSSWNGLHQVIVLQKKRGPISLFGRVKFALKDKAVNERPTMLVEVVAIAVVFEEVLEEEYGPHGNSKKK